MADESMVERVARIVREKLILLFPEIECQLSDRAELEIARAAIEAMREPTAAMRDAGAESLYGHSRHKAEEWAKVEKYESAAQMAADAYDAMIDTALSPKESN